MTKPSVLVFDIELAPITAYVWARKDVNIALNQIKKEWSVIAWAAKWLGEPASKVIYKDQRGAKDIENDKVLISPLWNLLDKADLVITQNGKNFDSPKLNSRFIMHGMPPPSPYQHLDTFQIARRTAKFTSYKLEYLADKLCTKYKKLPHSKFPGMSLWHECLKGNIEAWDEMKRYNINDVLATEELYNVLKAWTPASTFSGYKGPACRVCGETSKMWKKGFELTRKGRTQKYQCQKCGAWTSGGLV